MGYANAPATRNVLAGHGIYISGYQWRWAAGVKGGTFPPHKDIDRSVEPYETSFEAQPGHDVNGDSCECQIVPQYRAPDGTFAKPGIVPIFQPPAFPVAASLQMMPQELDLSPLYDVLDRLATPATVQVTIPDGAIVVNIPQQAAPKVTVEPAVVNVPAPIVNVEPGTITLNNTEPLQRVSAYRAGVSGIVKIPAGYLIAGLTCETQKTAGSVKIGAGQKITVPKNTGFADDFDDAPLPADTVTFTGTVAYYVRLVKG